MTENATPSASKSVNPWLILAVVLALALGFALGNRDNSTDVAGSGGQGSPSTMASDSSMPATLLDVALQFHKEGKIEEAVKAYNAVLQIEPANKFALYNIGVIKQGQNDLVVAIDYYTKALDSDSQFQPARYNRGLAYRDSQQSDLAVADLQAVVKADPKNASAMYNLGNLLVSIGRTDEGGQLLADALTLNPSLANG